MSKSTPLDKYCDRAGITTTNLADAAGVRVGTASKWRKGLIKPRKHHQDIILAYLRDNGIDDSGLEETSSYWHQKHSSETKENSDNYQSETSIYGKKLDDLINDKYLNELDKSLLKQILDRLTHYWTAYSRSKRYVRRGNHQSAEQALTNLIQGLKHFEPQIQLLARASLDLGHVSRYLGKSEASLNYYKKAIYLLEETSLADMTIRIREENLHKLLSKVQDRRDREETLKELKSQYGFMGNTLPQQYDLNDLEDEQRAFVYLAVGDLYRRQTDWDEAQENYEEAEKLFEDLLNELDHRQNGEEKETIRRLKRGLASSLRKLGSLAIFRGEAKESETKFRDSNDQCEDIDDLQGMMKGFHHLAWAYSMQGYYNAARAEQKKAMEIVKQLGDELSLPDQAKSWRYYGTTLYTIGEYDEAQIAFNEAMQRLNSLMGKDIEREYLIRGSILLGQAQVAFKSKNLERATTLLPEAISALVDHDKFHYARAKSLEGHIHFKLGKIGTAYESYEQANKLFEGLKNKYYQIKGLLDLMHLQLEHPADDIVATSLKTNLIEIQKKTQESEDLVVLGIQCQLLQGKYYLAKDDINSAEHIFGLAVRKADMLDYLLITDILAQLRPILQTTANSKELIQKIKEKWPQNLSIRRVDLQSWIESLVENNPTRDG